MQIAIFAAMLTIFLPHEDVFGAIDHTVELKHSLLFCVKPPKQQVSRHL